MRILHVLSQTELTGSEVYAWELIKQQLGQGHQIFICSDKLHLDFSNLGKSQIILVPISTPSFFTRMKNIVFLRRLFKKNRFDIIHCHSRAACRHVAWAKIGTQSAIVTTLHGYQHSSFSKRLFNIYGDTVIAVCENLATQLRTQFCIDPHSIKVIRNPIQKFDANISNQSKLNISLIGRASGPKGQRLEKLFLTNINHWLEKYPDIKVNLILNGMSLQRKNALIKKLPDTILSRCFITEEKMNLKNIFSESKVVISSGRIAAEAFMAGCQVLSLGEACFSGLVDEKNFARCLQSNFGDIGPTEEINFNQINSDLDAAVKAISPDLNLIKKIEYEFSYNRICENIEEIYCAARAAKLIKYLPILMYHKIPDADINSKHKIFVNKANFEKHLRWLKFLGFQSLSFRQLKDLWYEKIDIKSLPRKPIILTFDDGYKDNLLNAQPLLKKYNFKATLFLLSDKHRTMNDWDQPEPGVSPELLNIEERKTLDLNIYEIGSHGKTHQSWPSMERSLILDEMTSSKIELESEFGTEICALAYPFGDIDSRLPDLARQSRYEFGVNTDRGPVRWQDDRFSLFRINIFPNENFFSILKKTSRSYRKRYFRKRGQ